jgi:hypothetical protein
MTSATPPAPPGIPPLAGVCSYEEAARIGYPVEENVRRLLCFHWVEKRLLEIAVSRITATPEWEVKGALAYHQWLDAEHADALRTRIHEMRHPVPRLDGPPDRALEAFLAQVAAGGDTVELLAGIYGVVRPALLHAYRRHLAATNPLVDHPTRRVLRIAVAEEEEALAWGTRALGALFAADPESTLRAARWQGHLERVLAAAGGIVGDSAAPAGPLPTPRPPVAPDFHPRRDARFRGSYNFEFPPHVVYNHPDVPADERNLALLCKRLLEVDVPEMMASFIAEQPGKPWEFYREYARQLWDEARHSMMGEAAFQARGVDWRARIPLNVGFALRLNLHAEPRERQLMLFGIEQSLMPGDTGKRFEHDTAVESDDDLSAHFHDYDWADEVLHAQIGRRRAHELGVSPAEAVQQAAAIHAKTWAALDRYKDRAPQDGSWWRDLVREVLGKESAVEPGRLGDPTVIPE